MDNYAQIINRFANQSFGIKALSLSFLGLIFSSYRQDPSPILLVMLILAVIIFWLTDAYYLKMERTYREIDQEITNKRLKNPPKWYNHKMYAHLPKQKLIPAFFSKTVCPLYIIQLLLMVEPYLEEIFYWLSRIAK